MTDPTSNYIEALPFFWGVAFVINSLMGALSFTAIIRQGIAHWAIAPVAWVGWFTFATALSLLINLTMGPNYPFSYHQLGLFLETMTNVGFMWFMVTHLLVNFGIKGEDWTRIDELRKQITVENMEPKHANK